MNQPQLTLAQQYPGGCFLGFNAAIDRKAAEQISFMFSDAVRQGFTEINLLLSSTGGTLDHTYYVCNILDAMPVRIVTYNIGSVMSSANLLFLCGDERYAAEGATFYFHQTSFPPPADQITASFARSRKDSIDREDSRSAQFVSQKTGVPAKTVKRWQRSELFVDTKSALANGIIHGIKTPTIPPDAFFAQIII